MNKLLKNKKAIIAKAESLGIEYEATYKGCGQCTFLAIIDALRWGGLELIPREVEDRLFSGICVLTGGVGLTGEGTCGAVTSSVLAIGLALGLTREGINEASFRDACTTVRETILERYNREYPSILCKDVQRKIFGKSWDLTSDEMSREFLGITHGCTIMQTAKWAVEVVLDEYKKGNVRIPEKTSSNR